MTLRFLLPIILLSLPTNAFTLKSNSTSSSKNDYSNSLLYAIEANSSADNWFDARRYHISDSSFIKKTKLELFEFLSGKAEKSYYGVKFCQAKIPWPRFQRLNACVGAVSNEEDGDQECSYTIFEGDLQEMRQVDDYIDKIYNNNFQETVGGRLPQPGDRSSDKSFFKRTNLNFLEEQEKKSYNYVEFCLEKIPWPPQQIFSASDGEDGDQECSYTNFEGDHEEVEIQSLHKIHISCSKETARDGMPAGVPLIKHEWLFLKPLPFSWVFYLWLIIAVAHLGYVIVPVAWRWLCNIIKKRKDIKMNQKFFEQNGGLLLKQLLNSCDANVDRAFKIFTSMEIDKATDYFNMKRILGQGGQGTVYKGMLEDGRIIAVKKSNVVDEEKIEEFINEVVILAQINHRNVVKLLGCCLETEIPLLVYEFIPNGTLSKYLHDQNEQLPLKWDTRLQIAIEVSSALSYMHSGASFSIFHRDIKSTNILLDSNYMAKVADFGASRLIDIHKTHLSTIVLGTLGYLDPKYFQSSKLTCKSDVYSFGVVLVELLTGQKPIFLGSSQENISLAAYFIRCMKEKRLYDILDDQVKQNGKKDDIMAFANLAKRCLNQNGKERPTMKEVVKQLEGIRLSKKKKVLLRDVIKRFSKGDRNNS